MVSQCGLETRAVCNRGACSLDAPHPNVKRTILDGCFPKAVPTDHQRADVAHPSDGFLLGSHCGKEWS